jgi:hypothetical protein
MTTSTRKLNLPINASKAEQLCQIVGYSCLLVISLDLLIFAMPPALSIPEWRIGFLQQLSDRSFFFVFGFAVLIYGVQNRRWVKQLSRGCLALGLAMILVCGVVAQDTLTVQRHLNERITAQSAQLNSRVQNLPKESKNMSVEQARQATQQILGQAELAKQEANASVYKNGGIIVGNLLIAGAALISLWRCNLRS